jgi:hypothetical protein
MKLRGGLYRNIYEIYRNFDSMPSNYAFSFTEDLFMLGKNLPSSHVKPVLGDSKFYFSNLFPPTNEEDHPKSKVEPDDLDS